MELVSIRLMINVCGKLCLGFLNLDDKCVKVLIFINFQNMIVRVVYSWEKVILFVVGKVIFVGLIVFFYRMVVISVIINLVIMVCRLVLELVLCDFINYSKFRVFSFLNKSCLFCQLNSVWLKFIVICKVVGKLIGMIDKNS